MKTTKFTKFVAVAAMAFAVVGCCQQEKACDKAKECAETKCCTKKFQKKYTNADFYTDGKFNEDVAMKAVLEMIEFYGLPYTDYMKENLWVVDFGMGDFENVGMGGIFWVNDTEHGYFAHTIYLLPGQMIPEHAHFATDRPAKFESWMTSKGYTYNYSEVGETTPGGPAVPASHGETKSKNWVIQNVGDIVHLKEIETFHYQIAGDEGAIVEEWATYHDGAGLRFSSPKAKM